MEDARELKVLLGVAEGVVEEEEEEELRLDDDAMEEVVGAAVVVKEVVAVLCDIEHRQQPSSAHTMKPSTHAATLSTLSTLARLVITLAALKILDSTDATKAAELALDLEATSEAALAKSDEILAANAADLKEDSTAGAREE